MENNTFNKDNMELGNVNQAYENDVGQTEIQEKHNTTNGLPKVNGEIEKTGPEDAEEEKEDDSSRPQWSNGLEFLMSCIAMSVGLGNIWRFPYTAFNNGGGAFLIPYIIVLLVIGKPLYYLEMALGQFIAAGPVKVWHLSPVLRGLGYGQILATTMVLTYYCSLMALTAFYFVHSFYEELPWSTCDSSWENCFDSKNSNSSLNLTGHKSSTELYFYKEVLKEKDNIDDGIGFPEWRLTLCLLFSWISVFLVIIKGVKSSGKASYFLALFPYVVMVTLLIRGVTLPGAGEGVLYFITPQWDQLLEAEVWYNAVTQAFFSLNICFGTLIMYSSYNDFRHNVYRDALIVTILDSCTSLLAGCTIFAILGNLMHEMGTDDIKQVVQGGTGIAFVSYPDAIAKFDAIPQFFAVVFFLMLFTLGVGSAVALSSAVITIICDRFTNLKHWWVALGTCIGGFLVGLVYVTPGGQYILTLVDFYGANFTVFILGTIEMVGLAWIYGVDNFCEDIEFMVGKKIGPYWRICWGIVTPGLMIIILLYSLVNMTPETYNGKEFPPEVSGAGWVIFAFGVMQFPIWAAVAFYKNRSSGILSAFKPSDKWHPENKKIAREWREYKEALKKKRINETFVNKLMRILLGRIPEKSTQPDSNNVPDKY